jgi:hypothetical protein
MQQWPAQILLLRSDTMRIPVLLLLLLSLAGTAGAQRTERIGIASSTAKLVSPAPPLQTSVTPLINQLAPVPITSASFKTRATDLPGNSGMPRWLRWGLVGAVGGAALFTLVDGLNGNSRSVGSDILAGAATGFVVVGGGVLVYDAICSPSSGGRRSGC